MTDSATFTAPEASDEDLGDLLLKVLPPDGSTLGSWVCGTFVKSKANSAEIAAISLVKKCDATDYGGEKT